MVNTFSQMMVKLQASNFHCNSLTGKPGTSYLNVMTRLSQVQTF